MKNKNKETAKLKVAFDTILQNESMLLQKAEQENGEHEFSAEFEEKMHNIIKTEKTLRFKLMEYKKYIGAAAAVAVVLVASLVATNITPPKKGKTERAHTAFTASRTEGDSDNAKKDNEIHQSNKDNNYTAENSNSSENDTKPDEVIPWDENQGDTDTESEMTTSEIYIGKYSAPYKFVFSPDSDGNYTFKSTDTMYTRWNDLAGSGFEENGTDITFEQNGKVHCYRAVSLKEYKFSKEILFCRGEPETGVIDGQKNSKAYKINYRNDLQFLIIEDENDAYLAKYICTKTPESEKLTDILNGILGVNSGASLKTVAMLNNSDNKAVSKQSLQTDEIAYFYESLNSLQFNFCNKTNLQPDCRKIIIETENGGVMYAFYSESEKSLCLGQNGFSAVANMSSEQNAAVKELFGIK